jgi:CDGSH-type Zn-finger protein
MSEFMDNEEKTMVEIKAIPDGPLEVSGIVELILPDGTGQKSGSPFLCRCGKSGNKPFCDGSHSK